MRSSFSCFLSQLFTCFSGLIDRSKAHIDLKEDVVILLHALSCSLVCIFIHNETLV